MEQEYCAIDCFAMSNLEDLFLSGGFIIGRCVWWDVWLVPPDKSGDYELCVNHRNVT